MRARRSIEAANIKEQPLMKKQTQIKKLVLAKETLLHLDEKEVLFAVGGISGSICGNPTCKLDCGPTALC